MQSFVRLYFYFWLDDPPPTPEPQRRQSKWAKMFSFAFLGIGRQKFIISWSCCLTFICEYRCMQSLVRWWPKPSFHLLCISFLDTSSGYQISPKRTVQGNGGFLFQQRSFCLLLLNTAQSLRAQRLHTEVRKSVLKYHLKMCLSVLWGFLYFHFCALMFVSAENVIFFIVSVILILILC